MIRTLRRQRRSVDNCLSAVFDVAILAIKRWTVDGLAIVSCLYSLMHTTTTKSISTARTEKLYQREREKETEEWIPRRSAFYVAQKT